MKKTVKYVGLPRRLVLAHETLRKLGADLAAPNGGSGAINTTTQASLGKACTFENTVCVGQGCAPATDGCRP